MTVGMSSVKKIYTSALMFLSVITVSLMLIKYFDIVISGAGRTCTQGPFALPNIKGQSS
jgi:hypothetical protein